MDVRWFIEDRRLPKDEQPEAIEESKKVLKNSTLMSRRLKLILEDEINKSILREEDYDGEGWERHVLRQNERRKTLREIHKLLP